MINPMFILNRADLAKKVSEVKGISKAESMEIVKDIFEEISEQLAQGNSVNIPGFGKFEIKERSSREGINPATGEKIEISESKTPSFKAAKALKERITQ